MSGSRGGRVPVRRVALEVVVWRSPVAKVARRGTGRREPSHLERGTGDDHLSPACALIGHVGAHHTAPGKRRKDRGLTVAPCSSAVGLVVVIADIASLCTSVGVLIAIYQLFLSRQQARAVFEQSFVDRFWSIEDDRLRRVEPDEVNRRRYLRLCEDQYEHARMKQLSGRTWDIWHEGIQAGVGDSVEHAGEWTKLCARAGIHLGRECPALQRL